MPVTDGIRNLLMRIEAEKGVEILYACESGSRAWGFASPDSDYDIRFLYRRPLLDSYGIELGADTIECPIVDDLDPGGWELRKALGLLRKSNGALIEWLRSPIVYRANASFHGDVQQLIRDHLSVRGLANHYRGLANGTYNTRIDVPEPSAKAYLYCLRAVLAAHHVLNTGSPPPVPFAELIPIVPAEVKKAIHELLAWKCTAPEKASPGHLARLDVYLAEAIPALAATLDAMEETPVAAEPFDEVLRRWTLWPSPLRGPRLRKDDFTLSRVRQPDLLLFEAISGSRAFGTHGEQSDTDLRGVFVAPVSFLCGLDAVDQVSDEKGDEVYYELGRFVSLLAANNPNLIELLYTPADCLRFRHPAFDLLKPEVFLSKICRQSFGNYAMGQIRKARGLNKKIVNPEPETRRQFRDFCHILEGQGAIPLDEWLAREGLDENRCALVAARHAPGTYAVFHDPAGTLGYRGLFSKKDESALVCSSVPREATPLVWMHCNLDAFKAHCRNHREYWLWVKERNEDRYETNTAHGRGYDSKNLMHTLRLLDQAIEIARDHRIVLPRPNADWLKQVKSGSYSYDDLLTIAEEKHLEMESAFETSTLPDQPSSLFVGDLLLSVREAFAR
jgi:predicted nucleotidyltransferase